MFQLDRLLELKNYCDEVSQTSSTIVSFSKRKWKEVHKINEVLKTAAEMTSAMQGIKFTMSDFYGFWIETKLKLGKMTHQLANDLLQQMQSKENILFQNKIMEACLLLDPRYQVVLSEEQRKSATYTVLNLFTRVQAVSEAANSDRLVNASGSLDVINTNVDDIQDNSEEDLLELHLRQCEELKGRNKTTSHTTGYELVLLDQLNEFGRFDRVDKRVDVFEYWRINGKTLPLLATVADVLFAVPVTQASVERTFSTLKFIFNRLRTNLKGKSLEQIMIIKLNKDLLSTEYLEALENILMK